MLTKLASLSRRWALPLISVIGTGLVGAVCIALMTSGKVSFVSAGDAARLAIFIAFQVLGITLVKAGLDSYLFARAASEEEGALYNLRPIFRANIFRVWIAFSIGSYFILGTWLSALICSVSVLCDVYAAVRTAEYTARQQFRIVAIANLTKYPLYFSLLFIIGTFLTIGYNDLLYLFLFISLFRSLVLFVISAQFTFESVPTFSFGLLGLQQIFNYMLFRLDQISMPLISRSMPALDSTGLSDFVFLTKYPELVSYFAAALGSIVFPKLDAYWGSNSHDSRRERWLINMGLVVLCVFGLLIYVVILQDGIDISYVFLPLVLAAFLSFEVNFVSFRMLSENSFKRLLVGSGIGVLFGVIIAIFAGYVQSIMIIYWVVPVQMIVFLMVSNRVK